MHPTSYSTPDPPPGGRPPSPFGVDPAGAGPDARPGGTLIRATVGVTVLLTIGIVALIYFRWIHSHSPSSCIILRPNAEELVAGTEVTVSTDEGTIATVTMEDRAESPVLVEPGVYTLTMTYQGKTTRQRIAIPNRRLVPVLVTTRPSAGDNRGRASP